MDSKICGVCGDKALGYNFNAVTCESCKAFFRRNALAKKDFRCPFNEQCLITTITRRFCQKCRLDKCFAIGMRKDYIMTEEDKELKRQKIQQNKVRKQSNGFGFKQSFKKVKREINKEEFSETNYNSSDADSYKDSTFDQTPQNSENNFIGNLINYTNTDLTNRIYEESSSNGNTTSSEDCLIRIEDSVIRNILNNTSKTGVSNKEEEDTTIINVTTNNNKLNCNHNIINKTKNTKDTAKDILEDVQRFVLFLFCLRI